MTHAEPRPPGIGLAGVSKSFGETQAVDRVDLDIPEGAVFGLLGPDGAGKSTLIRMIATVLVPDHGDASVFGESVTRNPDRLSPRIGYMSQRFSMYPDLTVAENLEFFARVRGVPKPRRRARAAELLESMGIADVARRQARFLSGGMKQKLMLASTLMHDPDLLLLDEPTTGVDPVSRREFWRILADIHAKGRTVVVATPYMDEAERCTQIAFMDSGRIIRSGTPQQLKDSVPGTLFEVWDDDPRAVLAALVGAPGIATAHLLGDVVRVLVEGGMVPEIATDDLPADEAARLLPRPSAGPQPSSTNAPPIPITDALAGAGIEASIREVAMDMESVFAFLAAEAVPV